MSRDEDYPPDAIAVLHCMEMPRRPAGFVQDTPASLLLQAVEHLPESDRADVRALVQAGEFGEAILQLRGSPAGSCAAIERLALVELASEMLTANQ